MDNTEKKRIKILNYRTSQGIAPKPENIVHGEIAIGYKKDNEAIYIKNTANDIVDFTPISIINITYNKLKELRNNSKLKPSQYYRITDFVTTVANDPEAQSAGHPFDLIILATDKNKLQEECYAIQHEGDEYFKNCNLAAWKIWYCLDNDRTKYAWADTTNGKGVIYRMIDEWQNDCPYDFKNVQFKRYRVTDNSTNGELSDLDGTYVGYNGEMKGLIIEDNTDFIWAYTFSLGVRTTTPVDASIIGYNNSDLGGGYGGDKGYYGDNSIKPTSMVMTVDSSTSSVFCLNNIVWWTNNIRHRSLINGNRIESECFNMTLSGNSTIIEYDCQNFIMGDGCYENVFGAGGALNTFGNYCDGNTFGNCCRGNSFGDDFEYNTFGNDCGYNSFGDFCSNNQFGNHFESNTFGDNCATNQFGDYFGSNTFGNDCSNNQFGNSCHENSFGGFFESNTFGNNCGGNLFGDFCSNNQFGNHFESNTFGNDCSNNQFGNNCGGNSFGINCDGDSFGNNCNNNQFGDHFESNTFGDFCSNNQFGNNFQYNALGNDVEYVEIATEKIYYTQILNGTKGTSSEKLTIEFTPETEYSQFAGLTSNNELKTWVEADVPTDVVDGGSY